MNARSLWLPALIWVCAACFRTCSTLEVRVDEEDLKKIVEYEQRDVRVSVSRARGARQLWVEAEIADPYLAELNGTKKFRDLCLEEGEEDSNFTVGIVGKFLGYTSLRLKVYSSDVPCGTEQADMEPTLDLEFPLSVVRPYSVLVIVFTAVMGLFVSINYINMGCQLELGKVWAVLKAPLGPIIGFLCQFIFMPVAAYGVGYFLLEDPSLRLGLFTLGCSPGGSMSNFWTLLFDGDLNLSITMTFISTVAALGMMPLWIFTLGKSLFQGENVSLPYPNLAASLVGLTLPIGIGLLIRRYRPHWTKVSAKIIKPFTIFCIVVGISVGMYANRFIFYLFTWRIVLAGLAIAWGGYLCGFIAALVARLPKPQVIAIAIETAFQNAGVAFVMLMLSLPQPDADLTAVPLVAQLMLTGLPMWLIYLTTKIVSFCKKSCRPEDEKKKLPPPCSV